MHQPCSLPSQRCSKSHFPYGIRFAGWPGNEGKREAEDTGICKSTITTSTAFAKQDAGDPAGDIMPSSN